MSKPYYNKIKKIVANAKLPKSYTLPAYDSFDWVDIPDGWTYVLTPRGLSLEQWDKLLKNKCNGLYTYGYPKSPFIGKGWELKYAATQVTPTINDVSYIEAKTQYGQLLSVEAYLALQWQQLEQDLEPVDKIGWTWLEKEDNFKLSDLRAPFGRWSPDDGQVRLYWYGVGYRFGLLGVRLPVWGENSSVLTASNATPLSLYQETTDYLLDKGHTITKPLIDDIVGFIENQATDKGGDGNE